MSNKIFSPLYMFTDGRFKKNMSVAVSGDTIIKIGSSKDIKSEFPDYQEESGWSELVMLPGGVNVHNHSFQSLLRGIACDRPFLEWRDKALYKYSPVMTQKDIYTGALFSFGEMMKYGATAVSDFFYLHNYGLESDEMIIKAAKDLGIRLVLSRTMYDWNGAPEGYRESVSTAVENTLTLHKKYISDPMVTIVPSPHSLHGASADMICAGAELAEKMNVNFHIHVAEEPFEVEQVMKEHNGMTTVEYLDSIGAINQRTVIIHGVYLKDTEIELLGRKKAKLAYCPSSNMFLADGITDIPKMTESGVKIGLGTDGACSNNRNSVFEEMRMTALLQKAKTCNAMCVDYRQAFDMGTKNGAEILGLKSGVLAENYKADFIGISCDELSMQPISESGEQLLANIVYSMQPSAVNKVVVGGKETVSDGKLLNISEQEIISKIKQTMKEIESR